MESAQRDGSDELGWIVDLAARNALGGRYCLKAAKRAHARLLLERMAMDDLRASMETKHEENERLRAVVEVARRWRPYHAYELDCELEDAVDAYEAALDSGGES